MQTLPNTNGVDLDRNEIVYNDLVRMSFMLLVEITMSIE